MAGYFGYGEIPIKPTTPLGTFIALVPGLIYQAKAVFLQMKV
jgi:hypothetical protein